MAAGKKARRCERCAVNVSTLYAMNFLAFHHNALMVFSGESPLEALLPATILYAKVA